jgi:hypothetical protein
MLTSDPIFDRFFRKLVQTLNPYLGELVCIGGCANALYRHHPLAAKDGPAYLGTMDVDWAVCPPLQVKAESKLVAALMSGSGFKEEMLGGKAEPVVKYVDRSDPAFAGAEVEFLCPLSGARGTRKRALASTPVQAGLRAQPLRYLDLLLHEPWAVRLSDVPGFEDLIDVQVRVPNPAAYFVQKVLIRSQGRERALMEKDCYYLYEVSVLFRNASAELKRAFESMRSSSPAWAKWLTRFQGDAAALFDSAAAEGPTTAVRVYRDTFAGGKASGAVTPEMVCRSVQKILRLFRDAAST